MARAIAQGQPSREIVLSIMYYTACSSVMLVANKVAVFHVPLPGLVSCVQLGAAVAFIFLAKSQNILNADPLQVDKALDFSPYAVSFVLSVYANMRALQASNVETVIVFRACSPLLVSILDWLFLDREFPNLRSLGCLLCVLISAISYVHAERGFSASNLAAYGWSAAYLLLVVYSMIEGKRLLSRVKFQAPIWGSVLYTNALSLPGMLAIACVTGEPARIASVALTPLAVFWLLLSCAVGVGISWAGWNCREKTTATTYTVIGLVCKLATVLFNALLWDKRASFIGSLWLLVCLLASGLYRQAPERSACSAGSGSLAACVASVPHIHLGKSVARESRRV